MWKIIGTARVKSRCHQFPLMFVAYFFNMLHGHHTLLEIDYGLGYALLTKHMTFSPFVKRVKSRSKAIKFQ